MRARVDGLLRIGVRIFQNLLRLLLRLRNALRHHIGSLLAGGFDIRARLVLLLPELLPCASKTSCKPLATPSLRAFMYLRTGL